MEHVATEPLSRMTFRSLASALGVSTYSFIYHFGSRQQMVDAILEEAVRQQSEPTIGIDIAAFDREQFADWYTAAFRRSLSESNRTSLRLQFEAGALEPIDPDLGTRITSSFRDWLGIVQRWLAANGVEQKRAAVLARWLADTAAGLRFGYLMTGDREKTLSAFDVFLGAYLREAVGP